MTHVPPTTSFRCAVTSCANGVAITFGYRDDDALKSLAHAFTGGLPACIAAFAYNKATQVTPENVAESV